MLKIKKFFLVLGLLLYALPVISQEARNLDTKRAKDYSEFTNQLLVDEKGKHDSEVTDKHQLVDSLMREIREITVLIEGETVWGSGV